MCGIAGLVGVSDRGVIRRMTSALSHRGPDQSAVFSSADVHLGVTRLSIVDPVRGRQPVFDADRRCCVVLNGEIYNHRALRRELIGLGYRFSSSSDSEVLLYAFKHWGAACVERLSGMYAFAAFDGEKVVLARDPFGIKPLYWTQAGAGGAFAFASEIKALLASRLVSPDLCIRTFADQAVLGFPIGNRTLFQDIVSFQPGLVMAISATGGAVTAESVGRKERPKRRTTLSFAAAVERLDAFLEAAVSTHMDADVPVALTLSGGIDSAVLASYIRNYNGGNPDFFTVGDADDHPDVLGAKRVAASLGAAHSVTILTAADVVSTAPKCILADEQPCSFATHGLFMLFRSVARRFKACLNGEGADELFGGYPEYLAGETWLQGILARKRRVAQIGLSLSDSAQTAIEQVERACRSSSHRLNAIFDFNLGDQLTRRHLERLDKYAMANSVEVRVPYLADEVAAFVEGLPMGFKVDSQAGVQKKILLALAERRLPNYFGASPKRKIGLPGAGARVAGAVNAALEEFSQSIRRRHSLGGLLRSCGDLLMYDLFEDIFVRRGGDLDPSFDPVEFFAARLAVRPILLRERLTSMGVLVAKEPAVTAERSGNLLHAGAG